MSKKQYQFKLSAGNTKLGNITNINVSTDVCKGLNLPCYKNGCYACKGRYLFSNVQNRLKANLEAYLGNHIDYTTEEILEQLPSFGRVRWHSAGEIVDLGYLFMMIDIAKACPDLKFLAYTKRYELVNMVVSYGHKIPENLTIVFSEWEGLQMENPYSFPVATVDCFKSDYISTRTFNCSGNCSTCSLCWNLKKGDRIIFHKH